MTLDGTLVGGARRLSLAELDSLGVATIECRVPWYPDLCRFEGVRLSRLRSAFGAGGTIARVQALNDYSADIPLSDFDAYGPILASRRNGQLMPVSDKGPLFVVYPFNDIAETRHQVFYARSVWQVARIDFL